MGSYSLLQGLFLTQELNLSLLHCMQILYHLSHQGSPTRATWLPGSSTPGRCRGVPSPPQPFPILKGGLPPSCGFPGGSGGEESACNLGDLSWIPGLGRSPGGGHGNPLQYSHLENPQGQRSLGGCSPRGHKLPPKYAPVFDGCFS